MFTVIKKNRGKNITEQFDSFEDAFYFAFTLDSLGFHVEIHDKKGLIENFK